MTNTKPLNTPVEPHNQKAAGVWSSGGSYYNQISRGITDAIQHCIFRLNPLHGDVLLDVATGTGWTARGCAVKGAKVTGIDIAEDLVQAAREISESNGVLAKFMVGDAESLPFADASFDKVISTFGVMFVGRPEVAAAQLGRVCRKGGMVALTTWKSESTVGDMFRLMKPYMAPPPSPAPPSPFEWGKRERLRELLGKDFELRFEDGTSFFREPSAEEAWNVFSAGYGPTKSLAQTLPPDRRDSLKKEFMAFHDQFRTELGFSMPRDYVVTIGTRK